MFVDTSGRGPKVYSFDVSVWRNKYIHFMDEACLYKHGRRTRHFTLTGTRVIIMQAASFVTRASFREYITRFAASIHSQVCSVWISLSSTTMVAHHTYYYRPCIILLCINNNEGPNNRSAWYSLKLYFIIFFGTSLSIGNCYHYFLLSEWQSVMPWNVSLVYPYRFEIQV